MLDMITNFTEFLEGGMVYYAMRGYTTALGFLVYPLIFTGIIGYIYIKQQSIISAVVVILLLIGAFGTALVQYYTGVESWISAMAIFVGLGLASLFVLWLTKSRR